MPDPLPTKSGELSRAAVTLFWHGVEIHEGEDAFFTSLANLSAEQAAVFAVFRCRSEINNGGLLQFFDNSTGVLAPEAEAGFRTIGGADYAELLKEAMRFFGERYPRDRNARAEKLEAFGAGAKDKDFPEPEEYDPFIDLDKRFYELDDGTMELDKLLDSYVRDNLEAFFR